MTNPLVVAALFIFVASAGASGSTTRGIPDHGTAAESSHDTPGTIVLQNSYYAKPGKEDDVLRVRSDASAVLKSLGVRTGRILRRTKHRFDVPGANDPDVIWECEFPDEASVVHDARIVRASPEFDAVQKRMAAVAGNFESRRWTVQP